MFAKPTTSKSTTSSAGSSSPPSQKTTPAVGKLAGFNPQSFSTQRSSASTTRSGPSHTSTIAQAKAALFERAQASTPTTPVIAPKRASISSISSIGSVGSYRESSSPTTPVSSSPFRKPSVGSINGLKEAFNASPAQTSPSSPTCSVGNSPFKRSSNTTTSTTSNSNSFTPTSFRKPSVHVLVSVREPLKPSSPTTTTPQHSLFSSAPVPIPAHTSVELLSRRSIEKEAESRVPTKEVTPADVIKKENIVLSNIEPQVKAVAKEVDIIEDVPKPDEEVGDPKGVSVEATAIMEAGKLADDVVPTEATREDVTLQSAAPCSMEMIPESPQIDAIVSNKDSVETLETMVVLADQLSSENESTGVAEDIEKASHEASVEELSLSDCHTHVEESSVETLNSEQLLSLELSTSFKTTSSVELEDLVVDSSIESVVSIQTSISTTKSCSSESVSTINAWGVTEEVALVEKESSIEKVTAAVEFSLSESNTPEKESILIGESEPKPEESTHVDSLNSTESKQSNELARATGVAQVIEVAKVDEIEVNEVAQVIEVAQVNEVGHIDEVNQAVEIAQANEIVQTAKAAEFDEVIQVAEAAQLDEVIQVAEVAEVTEVDEAVQVTKSVQVVEEIQIDEAVQVVEGAQIIEAVQVAEDTQIIEAVQVVEDVQIIEAVQVTEDTQIVEAVQVVEDAQIIEAVQVAKGIQVVEASQADEVAQVIDTSQVDEIVQVTNVSQAEVTHIDEVDQIDDTTHAFEACHVDDPIQATEVAQVDEVAQVGEVVQVDDVVQVDEVAQVNEDTKMEVISQVEEASQFDEATQADEVVPSEDVCLAIEHTEESIMQEEMATVTFVSEDTGLSIESITKSKKDNEYAAVIEDLTDSHIEEMVLVEQSAELVAFSQVESHTKDFIEIEAPVCVETQEKTILTQETVQIEQSAEIQVSIREEDHAVEITEEFEVQEVDLLVEETTDGFEVQEALSSEIVSIQTQITVEEAKETRSVEIDGIVDSTSEETSASLEEDVFVPVDEIAEKMSERIDEVKEISPEVDNMESIETIHDNHGDPKDQIRESTIEEDILGLDISNAPGFEAKEDVTCLPYAFHWRHGGYVVKVTGSFDNWQETLVLSKVGDDFSGTINLDRTQHIQFKFVVDGEWKCSSDYPTGYDNHGNMNNILHPQDL
ncbi:hypothetical protein BGZ76_005067 [Entomortierella beljakovae]|nr:hypothetical protein BGZ76_005067 [Entomortierella beljakovae]